ncbi:Alpha/beta fold family hydrolase [Candidatus Terasakiella magnetica]|nr:Alpha/beta fold family hydrolase [Candidatus Terasakiella magnetica]
MLKVMLLTLLGCGALYMLMVFGMALFQRDMIYHPDTTRSDPVESGVPEMIPVPLKAEDGWVVTGWYAPPRKDPTKPTIVMYHGNSGTIGKRAYKARALLDAGYGVFLAEYRGYGGNPGIPSETAFNADGWAVVSWLIARGIPAPQIVLYGESLGSGVAMEMSRRITPYAVVLECPFTALPDLAPPYILPFLARAFMADHYDNMAKLKSLRAPLLVIHGERDQTTPVAMSHALLNAATGPKEGIFIATAGHNDLWDHGIGPRIVDFLERRGQ